MAHVLDGKRLDRLARSTTGGGKAAYFFLPFLSASIAGRDEAAMRLILKRSLLRGVAPRALDEIILQSHLFLGFPAMIEASRIFAEVRGRNSSKNGLPQAYRSKTVETWHRDGLGKIKKIYGPSFGNLVSYINAFSPQILTWMVNDGYGKVLSRPGVSFSLRELAVVATLTVSGYDNQLWAHVRGALKVGVASELLRTTMDNCAWFTTGSRVTTAQKILDKALTT